MTERLHELAERLYETMQESASVVTALIAENKMLRSELDSHRDAAKRQFQAQDDNYVAKCREVREVRALRDALRSIAIQDWQEYEGDCDSGKECRLCLSDWLHNEPERHAPGCLAAGIEAGASKEPQ